MICYRTSGWTGTSVGWDFSVPVTQEGPQVCGAPQLWVPITVGNWGLGHSSGWNEWMSKTHLLRMGLDVSNTKLESWSVGRGEQDQAIHAVHVCALMLVLEKKLFCLRRSVWPAKCVYCTVCASVMQDVCLAMPLAGPLGHRTTATSHLSHQERSPPPPPRSYNPPKLALAVHKTKHPCILKFIGSSISNTISKVTLSIEVFIMNNNIWGDDWFNLTITIYVNVCYSSSKNSF